MYKKLIGCLTAVLILFSSVSGVKAEETAVPVNVPVNAKSYVLIDALTGKVIVGSNEHKQLPIASTTKIMTALITLEQPNLDENFIVDSNAIKVEGTSMGLVEGDSASLYTLANGMLLPSGNDAANAAAVKIAGTIDEFSKLMNQKAQELSMKNTNFVTPSGLHDENHYSTAYDMAILARAAIKNDKFAEICKKPRAQVEFGNPPYKRYLSNHNKLVSEYEGCIGVKTGFTKKAGRCLVSAVERDGVTLICVTLGAADDWNVHKQLFDYGFANLPKTEIVPNIESLSANIVGGEKNAISVKAHTKMFAPLEQAELSKLTAEIYLDRFYYAPIIEGDIIGEIKYYLDGNEVASSALVAGEKVRQQQVAKTKKQNKKFLWFGL